MAQVDGNQQYQPIKIDFTNPQVIAQLPTGTVSAIDPTQDAWEIPPPPPKGLYRLKLFLSDQGITLDYKDRQNRKKEEAYYNANLECRIVDNKDWENRIIFSGVSTNIRQGKAISTMVGLLIKMGLKMQAGQKVDDITVVKAFLKGIQKEPVLQAFVDWQGGYKPEATTANPNPYYKIVFKTMDEFPVMNGVRQHIWMYALPSGQREEIRAQAKIMQWFGAGETPSIPANQAATVEQVQAPEMSLGDPSLDFGASAVGAGAAVETVGDELAFG